jgi:hypothetical protein
MAYYPRSALSTLVNNKCLETTTTSIELLRHTFDRVLGEATLDVHNIFGDEILEHLVDPFAIHNASNIQLLQVFRHIQAA